MTTYLMIAIGVWALSLTAWVVMTKYLRSAEATKIQARLAESMIALEPEPQAGGKKDAGAKAKKKGPARLIRSEDTATGKIVLGLMAKYNLTERLQTLLEQAGMTWRPARLAHACLGLFLVGFLIGWQFVPGDRFLVNLGLGAAFGSLPLLHVRRMREKRLNRFEEIFPDSLEFVARSMRAGHAFSGALEMIPKEFPDPLACEYRKAFEEHNLGLPLDSALQKMGQRVPSLDLQFFISAVLLQKRTGGNLAEILDKLAYVIRERFKLRGKIRAISAHGRMTGTALSMIPLAVGLLMFWVNPSYARFFFEDEIGQYMAGAAIGLQLLGYAIISKIVQIEI